MEQEEEPKKGRPTKFNATVRDKIMALAGAGKTDIQIAEGIGVTERTLNIWKHSQGEVFFQSLKDAKHIADELVEAALFRKAVGFKEQEVKVFQHDGRTFEHVVEKQHAPDTNACKYWLNNRKSQEWRDKIDSEEEDIEGMEF